MKSKGPPTPYGYTIFCDDIREEMRGKASYIGIYRDSLIVNSELPINLAKLAFAIHLVLRPKDIEKLKGPIDMKIFTPGGEEDEPIAAAQIQKQQLAEAPIPDSDDPIVVVGFHVVAAPFALREEGRIKVRAYNDNNEWRLGTLRVVQRLPDPEPAENSAQESAD